MKSKKKQKGGSSNNGIIVVAVILLLVGGFYLYYSSKSDESVETSTSYSDVDNVVVTIAPRTLSKKNLTSSRGPTNTDEVYPI